MPIHPTADVDPSAEVSSTASIWQYAHVRERARIEDAVIIGRGVYIGPGVPVGRDSKIQNYALIYEPATLGAGVFVGPGVILTNDHNPRAVDPAGRSKSASDWTAVGVALRDGASVGARAVLVAPVTIGSWAMVAAGAVVIRDVADFELVGGNPARHLGWVGKAGHRLRQDSADPSVWLCPKTGERYRLEAGLLHEHMPAP